MRLMHLALFFWILLAPVFAWGQRGIPFSERGVETPLSAFPGVYDTFTAPEGALIGQTTALLVRSVPLFGVPVDYGLTENFTVGTNAVFPLLWQLGVRSFGAKIRYRMVPASRVAIALTDYGYWFDFGNSSPSSSSDTASLAATSGRVLSNFATVNGSWFLSERTWFTTHLSRFSLWRTLGKPADPTYSKGDESVAMWGAGVEHFFSRWFGVRAFGVVPFFISSENDAGLAAKSGFAGTASIWTKDMFEQSTLNLTGDVVLGEDWMFSLGAVISNEKELSGVSIDIARRFLK